MHRSITRRRFLAATVAGTVSTGLAGCGLFSNSDDSGASGTTTLRVTWWGNPARNAATLNALHILEKRDAKVKFQGSSTSFDGYFTKLGSQIASGDPPDVIQMSIDYIAEYGRRGSLLDLGSYSPGTLKLDDIGASAVDRGKVDGKLIALPFGLGAQTIFYNSTLFKSLGLPAVAADWNWDSLGTLATGVRAGMQSGH